MSEATVPERLARELSELPGVIARADEPLARHTPLRIGGPAELWVEAPDVDALRLVMRAVRAQKLNRWRLHWEGEGTLVRDLGIGGLVVRPGPGFEGLAVEEDGTVRLGAAEPFASLAALGPEWATLGAFSGCPGGLFNTGLERWLAGPLVALTVSKGRTTRTITVEPGAPPEPLGKSDVLLAVQLRASPVAVRGSVLGRPPRPSEPIAEPPPAACPEGLRAELTKLGLAGTRLRAWRLSEDNIGEVENLGGGSCADLIHLFRAVEDRMLRSRGLELTLGLPVVGRRAAGAKRGRRRR